MISRDVNSIFQHSKGNFDSLKLTLQMFRLCVHFCVCVCYLVFYLSLIIMQNTDAEVSVSNQQSKLRLGSIFFLVFWSCNHLCFFALHLLATYLHPQPLPFYFFHIVSVRFLSVKVNINVNINIKKTLLYVIKRITST